MKESPYGNHLANWEFGKAQAPFPLTLTLSLRERGKPGCRLGCRKVPPASPAPVFARNRTMILPLPEGEGRDEGEGRKRTSMHPVKIEAGAKGETIRATRVFSRRKQPMGAATRFLKTL